MTQSSPASAQLWFEDFPVGREDPLGPLSMTRDGIIAFAREFDPQPFHLDDAAGEASLFGGLASSGWHTCALVHRMMCDAFMLDMAGMGSPGVDHLKWLKPVFPGDRLSGVCRVVDAREMNSRPGLGLVRFRAEVANQEGAPVYQMEAWVIVRKRPAA